MEAHLYWFNRGLYKPATDGSNGKPGFYFSYSNKPEIFYGPYLTTRAAIKAIKKDNIADTIVSKSRKG